MLGGGSTSSSRTGGSTDLELCTANNAVLTFLFFFSSDEKPSPSSHATSAEIFGIVFGIIVAILLTALTLYFVSKRTRGSSTNQREPSELVLTRSELNGTCGNTSNSEYSEILKRPPEVGKSALHTMSFHHLALL